MANSLGNTGEKRCSSIADLTWRKLQPRAAACTMPGLYARLPGQSPGKRSGLEDLTRYLQQLADDVDRRVKAGDLAHADALAARSEVLASQSALLGMRQLTNRQQLQWT